MIKLGLYSSPSRVSQTTLINFSCDEVSNSLNADVFGRYLTLAKKNFVRFHFQFTAIRNEIELIRNNIEVMKSLINEQKFHYKDKSIIQ